MEFSGNIQAFRSVQLVARVEGVLLKAPINEGERVKEGDLLFQIQHDTYDAKLDRFIEASPYPSWKLSKDFTWVAPKAYPSDGKTYDWDEAKKDWLERVVINGD